MAAAFSPDSKTLAATDPRGAILWDVVTGKEVGRFEARSSAWAVAFSPDGKSLAVADKNNVVQTWDIASGLVVGQIKGFDKEPVSLAFSPGGGAIAVATIQGTVGIWEVGGKESWRHVLPRVKTRRGVALAFAPGGKILTGIASDLTVRLWDVRDGRELRSFGDEAETLEPAAGPYAPAVLAYSPDGKTLATPGRGATIVLWDPATGREIRRWHSPDQPASAVPPVRARRPDSGSIRAGSLARPRSACGTRPRGKKPPDARPPRRLVINLGFAPDGKTLWSLGRDNSPDPLGPGERERQVVLRRAGGRWQIRRPDDLLVGRANAGDRRLLRRGRSPVGQRGPRVGDARPPRRRRGACPFLPGRQAPGEHRTRRRRGAAVGRGETQGNPPPGGVDGFRELAGLLAARPARRRQRRRPGPPRQEQALRGRRVHG